MDGPEARRTRSLRSTCLLAAALMLSACGTVAAAAGGRNTRPPPTWQRIESIARRFTTVYAGQAEDHGTVQVYITRGGTGSFAAALRAVLGTPTDGGYGLLVVHHTIAALEKVTLKLAHDPTIAAHKVKLADWGPDTNLSTVLVRVQSNPVTAARYLQARYGPGWITTARWSGPLLQTL